MNEIYYTGAFAGDRSYGNNLFHIGEKTVTEWASDVIAVQTAKGKNMQGKKGSLMKQGWGLREAVINGTRNGKPIKGMQFQSNIDLAHSIATAGKNIASQMQIYDHSGLYNEDLIRTSNASEAWNKLSRMTQGVEDGVVMVLDTETIGDIYNKTKPSGTNSANAYGITEFGVTRMEYRNGNIVNPDIENATRIAGTGTYSETIAVGIERGSAEDRFIANAITKFDELGWDRLTTDEQVAVGRASMYRNASFEKSSILDGFLTLNSMEGESLRSDHMRQGLRKLTDAFDRNKNLGYSTPQKVAQAFLEKINVLDSNGKISQEILSGKTILGGANYEFDYNAINNFLAKAGIKTNIMDLENYTADVVYGIRALAAKEGLDVNTYMLKHGINASGGSVEELLKGFGFIRRQLHVAGPDTINEVKVLDKIGRLAKEDMFKDATPTRFNAADGVLFFHHGSLNATNALEFASIAGGAKGTGKNRLWAATTPVQGRFWKLQSAGEVDLNTVDDVGKIVKTKRYVANLIDAYEAEKDSSAATVITLSSDTFEGLQKRINEQADFYKLDTDGLSRSAALAEGKVTKEIIEQTAMESDLDIARREWSRYINANDVAYSYVGKKQVVTGGINDLIDFLDKAQSIGNVGKPGRNKESVASILAAARDADIKMSPWQARAFAGNIQRISTSNNLVRNIVTQIENDAKFHYDRNAKAFTNINDAVAATIAFNKAYNNALSFMVQQADGGISMRSRTNTSIMSSIADANSVDLVIAGNIVRINATNQEQTARQFSNAVKSNLLADGKGFIDPDDLKEMITDLYHRNLISEDTYGNYLRESWKTIPANQAYNKLLGISNDIYENRLSQSSLINNETLIELNALTNTRFIVNGAQRTIDDMFKGNQAEIEGIVGNAIESVINPEKIGTSSSGVYKLDALYKQLGITRKEDQNLVAEIFGPTAKGAPNKSYMLGTKKGFSQLIVTNGPETSPLVLIAKDENMGRLLQDIEKGVYDTSSYASITKGGDIFNIAAVVELPYINKTPVYDVNDPSKAWMSLNGDTNPFELGYMKTVKMSDNHEIFVDPIMTVVSKNDKVDMYANSGSYDILNYYRQSAGIAMHHLDECNYAEFSRLTRSNLLKKLQERPSSSSYRALDDGTGKIFRQMQYTTADFLQGYRVNVGEAMRQILEETVKIEDNNNEELLSVLEAFYDSYTSKSIDTIRKSKNITSVINMPGFNEYFNKHLFVPFSADEYVTDFSKFNSGWNFIDVMEMAVKKDIAMNGDKSRFNNSVLDAFAQLKKAIDNAGGIEAVDQLTSVSQYQHGFIGIGASSATFNPEAVASSTMRPTYTAANNPKKFAESDLEGAVAVSRSNTASLNRYLAEDAAGLEHLETNFTVEFKTMSDYELGLALNKTNFQDIITDEIPSISKQNQEFIEDYFKGIYGSFYQDSMVARPSTVDTFAPMTAREAIKFELNLNKIDPRKTRSQLEKLLNGRDSTVIDRKTAIAISKAGLPMTYGQAPAVLTQQAIEELLSTGRTNLMPDTYGDLSLFKVHLDINEKAMVRFADINTIAERTGLGKGQVTSVMDRLFDAVFGENIALAGNPQPVKHFINMDINSKWNIMTTEYAAAGKLEGFTDFLNAFIENNPTLASGIKVQYHDGRILLDTENSYNYGAFVNRVFDTLTGENTFYTNVDETVNKNILQRYNNYNRNGVQLLSAQVQNVNEHMGKELWIDARMMQGWVLGDVNNLEEGANFTDLVRKYAIQYNGEDWQATDYAGKMMNQYSTYNNSYRIKHKRTDNGIFATALEAITGLNEGQPSSEKLKNYLTMDVNDFALKGVGVPHGTGMDAAAFNNTPFFIDGKPSQYLMSLADNDVRKLNGKKGLVIDLGFDISYKNSSGKTVNTDKIIIPFQNISSDATGKMFAEGTASATAQFLRHIKEVTEGGVTYHGKVLTNQELSTRISNAYEKYITEISKEISGNDKQAESYKAVNKFFMPTSTQMQASQEVSPLTERLVNNERLEEVNKIINDIQLEVQSGALDPARAKEYAQLIAERKNIYKTEAKEILSGNYSPLAGIKNKNVKRWTEHIDESGAKHYGFVATLSEDALLRQGLDFASVSKDVIEAYEKNAMTSHRKQAGKIKARNLEGLGFAADNAAFSYEDIAVMRKDMIDRLNKEFKDRNYTLYEIVGKDNKKHKITHIDPKRPLFGPEGQITKFLEYHATQGRKRGKGPNEDVLIDKINRAITNGDGAIDAVYKALGGSLPGMGKQSSIGHEFMKRVGTIGMLFRHPIFQTQPMARILLDENLNGTTVELWNPAFTYRTNIDFDGDTMFAATMLHGSSVLAQDEERFIQSVNRYNKFVKDYSRKGISEAIEEMSISKSDWSKGGRWQQASVLRQMDEESYEKATNAFLKAHGAEINKALEGVDSGIADDVKEMLIMNSDEVAAQFENARMNSVKNFKMIDMSIAAKERNLYIGSVSTPNYKTRNALIMFANVARENDNDELLAKVNDVITSAYDMFSKEGGIFSITEQTSINTKKAADALIIAKTGLYATGMNKLTHAYEWATNNQGILDQKKASKYITEGIADIIEGAGPNTFKFLGKEGGQSRARGVAALIGNTSFYDLTHSSITVAGIDDDVMRYLATFRGIAELYGTPELAEAAVLSRSLMKGDTLDEIAEAMSTIIGIDKDSILRGSMLEGHFRKLKEGLEGQEKLSQNLYGMDYIVNNGMYFVPGSSTELSTAYKYNGNGTFTEVNLDTGELLENVVSSKNLGEKLQASKDVGYFASIGDYQQSLEVRQAAGNALDIAERNSILSDFSTEYLSNNSISYNADITNATQQSLRRRQFINDISATFESGQEDAVASVNAYYLYNARLGRNQGVESIIDQLNDEIARSYTPENLNTKLYSEQLKEALASTLNMKQEGFDQLVAASAPLAPGSGKNIMEAIAKVSGARYNEEYEREFIKSEYIKNMAELDRMSVTGQYTIEGISGAKRDITTAMTDVDPMFKSLRANLDQSISDAEFTIASILRPVGDNNIDDAIDAVFGYTGVLEKGSGIVSFGKYMGFRFDELKADDFKEIMSYRPDASVDNTIARMIGRTQENLSLYNASSIKMAAGSVFDSLGQGGAHTEESLAIVEKMLFSVASLNRSELGNDETIIDFARQYNDIPLEQMLEQANNETATKSTSETIKQTTGGWLDSIKEKAEKGNWDMQKIKGGAIALAALGIGSSILHKKGGGSPLIPAERRDPERSSEPDYTPPGGGFPTSKNNVYMDEPSGLQFKVSAKTRSRMQAYNASTMNGAYGGGHVRNINVSQNMSTVNDNWLAERFADLAQ